MQLIYRATLLSMVMAVQRESMMFHGLKTEDLLDMCRVPLDCCSGSVPLQAKSHE
jgi:hypothetical protein